jgi:hypothetical protein
MERKGRFSVTGIGSVSLLMIWVVLCLVVFSILTVVTATRDYRFTQTLADHTTAYYQAVSQANETLAAVDKCLAQAPQEGFETAVRRALPEGVTVQEEEETLYLSFQTFLDDTQALFVSLRVNRPDSAEFSAGHRYAIVSWREGAVTDWQGDNTLTLLG